MMISDMSSFKKGDTELDSKIESNSDFCQAALVLLDSFQTSA